MAKARNDGEEVDTQADARRAAFRAELLRLLRSDAELREAVLAVVTSSGVFAEQAGKLRECVRSHDLRPDAFRRLPS